MRAGSDSREVRVKGRSPWATEVKNHLAPRYTYRKPGTLGMSGALFEVWIVTEAARGSGAQDGWRALIIALKLRSIVALDVFPRIAPTGKDFEVFNIHEHMKAIAPEQRRAVKKDGQTSLRKNVRIPQRIWYSCKQYENCRGRAFDRIDCRNVVELRLSDRLRFWKHVVWAWAAGWLHGTMPRQDEMPIGNAPPAPMKLATLAEEAIEDLANDILMAYAYRPEAPIPMVAHPQVQLQIHGEAMARASIVPWLRSCELSVPW